MNNNINYPSIEFVNTDTEFLVNSLIKSYEKFTGRTLYPADPTRLFILWIADIIIQERVIINESAKQNVPRYAEGEYLDSLAEIFKDTYRLKEQPSRCTFRFYLSTKLLTHQLIPKGTRITVDGNITFETVENLYIEPGQMSGDVQAVCQTNGVIGNGFIPGQITQLIDIFPYYQQVENITTSTGGAEKENDESFYQRMRESMESFSTAGPAGAYMYHARTATPLVSDVSVSSPEKGIVDVRVLLKNGELPDEEILKQISDVLTSEKVRPLTDNVRVLAPEVVNFNINIKYFLSNYQNGLTTEVQINNAIGEYIKWQTEKMGRDINPSYLVSLLMQTGIKRVEVIEPKFTVIHTGAVPSLKERIVINGGLEDE